MVRAGEKIKIDTVVWVTRSVIFISRRLLKLTRNKERNVDSNSVNGEKPVKGYLTISP